ncbi:fibronectin type III-like domain-contianing protein [Kribbella sp. NPDC005582]|uniref:fibronectin type III-like domain-contianing protein n=1 Tax=Kribbella sp. NPDC005582 TaxID=3156893 RepID=UPI0033AE62FE
MILAESTYRGTTAAELAERTRWDSFKAASSRVTVPLRADELALIDANLERVVEPGTFTLRVGTSATALPHTLRLTVI